ncbi:preprotein translocase subunit YajC [Desulfovibrio sp. OttesenSCG-928-A18]|nr:preprotein translocase subunit YajC [Desulfovibrio sp. OttesenSCG-928-A18]
MFWTTTAYAMGGAGAAGGGEASGFAGFIPLILMFAVFYFLLIRPQQKRAKEHKAMLTALKRGDTVVTMGGLYGTILEVAEDHLVIDLGDTRVKVSRGAISTIAPGSASPAQRPRSKKSDSAKENADKDKDAGAEESADKE